MRTWLLTIGNRDVQLRVDRLRIDLVRAARDRHLELDKLTPKPARYGDENRYTLEARVLGLIYEPVPEHSDLAFPLLDAFTTYLELVGPPERVILVLTDQSQIFSESARTSQYSPYWQDTCTLEPLLRYYFRQRWQFEVEPPVVLSPENRGIDHWDGTLALVEAAFQKLDLGGAGTVYVSHQAGTPALSSAVQFSSLSRFDERVRFLALNRFDNRDPVECIESSRYLKGIRTQEARRLVVAGLPGAALNLLNASDPGAGDRHPELVDLVNFFNLRSTGAGREQDFDIEQVARRLAEALDLIALFFRQRNYLSGIALLAAAHELFLKAAIFRALTERPEVIVRGVSLSPIALLTWNEEGLRLQKKDVLLPRFRLSDDKWKELKKEICHCLDYPEPAPNTRLFEANSNLRPWLHALRAEFVGWSLLDWLCDDHRDTEQDLRNQLMHNLRGVEEADVVRYLCGKSEPPAGEDVVSVYATRVREPFAAALIHVGSVDTEIASLDRRLQSIADSLIR
jgi:hypothetical protein